MTDHRQVYRQGADRYHRLITREDYQGNLLPAILRISPLEGLDLVDLGAGTGRLSCLLAPFARTTLAFDASHHMLEAAVRAVSSSGQARWFAAAADHRRIPLPGASADLVISGWSLCYLVVWEEKDWVQALEEGLGEIRRILRPDAQLIIIETLGTGVDQPHPPDKLKAYYEYLELAGFSRTWIRTDYQFQDQPEANELVGYFFGSEMLSRISPQTQPILPECTGLWWRTWS